MDLHSHLDLTIVSQQNQKCSSRYQGLSSAWNASCSAVIWPWGIALGFSVWIEMQTTSFSSRKE